MDAPDASFIQLGSGSSIVLDFGSLSAGTTSLLVFTFDDLYEATAKVEVNADNSSYDLVAGSVTDTQGTQSGTFYRFASFDVTSSYRYVRITDLGPRRRPTRTSDSTSTPWDVQRCPINPASSSSSARCAGPSALPRAA